MILGGLQGPFVQPARVTGASCSDRHVGQNDAGTERVGDIPTDAKLRDRLAEGLHGDGQVPVRPGSKSQKACGAAA